MTRPAVSSAHRLRRLIAAGLFVVLVTAAMNPIARMWTVSRYRAWYPHIRHPAYRYVHYEDIVLTARGRFLANECQASVWCTGIAGMVACATYWYSREKLTTRRCLKWIGLGFCVLTALLWFASTPWCLVLGGKRFDVTFLNGYLQVTDYKTPDPDRSTLFASVSKAEWLPRELYWWPPVNFWGKDSLNVLVTLWLPFAVVLIPTVFLWLRDRRFGRGHCTKCGYDLFGLPEPRCPECGKSFVPQEAQP